MPALSRNLPTHLNTEGGFGISLVFKNDVGGDYRRQAVQVDER